MTPHIEKVAQPLSHVSVPLRPLPPPPLARSVVQCSFVARPRPPRCGESAGGARQLSPQVSPHKGSGRLTLFELGAGLRAKGRRTRPKSTDPPAERFQSGQRSLTPQPIAAKRFSDRSPTTEESPSQIRLNKFFFAVTQKAHLFVANFSRCCTCRRHGVVVCCFCCCVRALHES